MAPKYRGCGEAVVYRQLLQLALNYLKCISKANMYLVISSLSPRMVSYTIIQLSPPSGILQLPSSIHQFTWRPTICCCLYLLSAEVTAVWLSIRNLRYHTRSIIQRTLFKVPFLSCWLIHIMLKDGKWSWRPNNENVQIEGCFLYRYIVVGVEMLCCQAQFIFKSLAKIIQSISSSVTETCMFPYDLR